MLSIYVWLQTPLLYKADYEVNLLCFQSFVFVHVFLFVWRKKKCRLFYSFPGVYSVLCGEWHMGYIACIFISVHIQ